MVMAMIGACGAADGFDAQRWAAERGNLDRPSVRAGMVGELREKHLRPGMARSDVRRLLGEPDVSAEQTDTWYLGRSRVGPSFERWQVTFDAQDRLLTIQLSRS
jgi:hypothetical protein